LLEARVVRHLVVHDVEGHALERDPRAPAGQTEVKHRVRIALRSSAPSRAAVLA